MKRAILSMVVLISACAAKPTRTEFYNAAGEIAQAVHCPRSEYESCLQQMGDLCSSAGYIVQEKIHQMGPGGWNDDRPEILLVAQCKNSGNLVNQGASTGFSGR